MSNDGLKPCPHCGGTRLEEQRVPCYSYVKCLDCNAQITAETGFDAERAWNRRVKEER